MSPSPPAFPATGCHCCLTTLLLSSSDCVGYAAQHCRACLVPVSPGTAPLSLLKFVDPRRLTTCRFTTYPVVSRGPRRDCTTPFSFGGHLVPPTVGGRKFGAVLLFLPFGLLGFHPRGSLRVQVCVWSEPPGSARVPSLQILWLCCGRCASQYPKLYGKTDSRDSVLIHDA